MHIFFDAMHLNILRNDVRHRRNSEAPTSCLERASLQLLLEPLPSHRGGRSCPTSKPMASGNDSGKGIRILSLGILFTHYRDVGATDTFHS
jgi:hypothetical protein